MNYCILRTAKLSTFASVAGSAAHTFREIPTPNADAARTPLNTTVGAQNSRELCQALKARLPEKRRSDAVLCIEYLITASPEWFHTAPAPAQDAYFKAALKWLQHRHGKDNVVCVNMQLDETSPHLVAYVVPLTPDGRLSAKEFLGGRAKLSKMQTEFAARIGAPVGLQRGVEGSRAVHTTNKQYNAALRKNPALTPPPAPAPTFSDRLTGRAKAMEEQYAVDLATHAQLVGQARNIALVSQKARARQAAALERLRKDAEAGQRHKLEVARLLEENKALAAELARQKFAFQEQLAAAGEQVKTLLAEVGRLKGKLQAAAALVHTWRARLQPAPDAHDLGVEDEARSVSVSRPGWN